MNALLRKNIFNVFWVIVLLGIVVMSLDIRWLDYIFKPLLMPVLLAAVFVRSARAKGRKKIILALFFSFCGDVFLLFEDRGSLFFIGGLICFLITHLFYIAYFLQIKQPGESPAKLYPYLVMFIAGYTAFLLYVTWPNLHELKIPVIIYACIISTMLYLSLCVPYKVGKTACQLFVTGAVFFVVSDSLLAANKFYKAFTLAPFSIRLTYCFAQYCIVKGFLKKRY